MCRFSEDVIKSCSGLRLCSSRVDGFVDDRIDFTT